MFTRIYAIHILSYENTFSLGHTLGFDYKVNFWLLLLIICDLILELIHFIRKEPCLRKEFVVFWELPLHLLQISSQIVFASDLEHAWEMIDPLMRLNFLEKLQSRCNIGPCQVPIGSRHPWVFLTHNSPSKYFFANFFDDFVLCV